jgi:hypothetical protein
MYACLVGGGKGGNAQCLCDIFGLDGNALGVVTIRGKWRGCRWTFDGGDAGCDGHQL